MDRITTFAGNGTAMHSGDDGPALAAGIHDPFTLAFDAAGNLLVAEAGASALRRIERRSGRMTTLIPPSGTFEDLVAIAHGNGQTWAALRQSRTLVRFPKPLTPTPYPFREPHDLALAPDGKALYIVDVGASRLYRLALPDGPLEPFAGTGKRAHSGDGGPALQADLAGARAVCCYKDLVYVVEREGNGVRRIDARGTITTVAGTGKKGDTGDGGPARDATFNGPKGACCDTDGNLFVVDTENHAIRRIEAKTGIVTTVAGGRQGFRGDGGPATEAALDRPHGAIIGPDGALYIADSANNRIRRVANPTDTR